MARLGQSPKPEFAVRISWTARSAPIWVNISLASASTIRILSPGRIPSSIVSVSTRIGT